MSKIKTYDEALKSDSVARKWDRLPTDRRSARWGANGLPENFTASPQLSAALDATTGLTSNTEAAREQGQ